MRPSGTTTGKEIGLSKKLGTLVPIAVAIVLTASACSGTEEDTGAMRPTPTSEPQAISTARAPIEPTAAPEAKATGLALGQTVIAPEGQRLTEVPLLTPVALRIGQKLASPSLVSGLAIDFVEVVEDSRCPIGAECPSPGTATVRIKTTSGVLDTGETTLVLESGQTEPTIKKLGKFSAVFVSLEPVPTEGETIDPDDYVATLAVLE